MASAVTAALRTRTQGERARPMANTTRPRPSATSPPREPVSTTEAPSRPNAGHTTQRRRTSGRSNPYCSANSAMILGAGLIALLALQYGLEREQRDEAGPEDHGAVVRVLAE